MLRHFGSRQLSIIMLLLYIIILAVLKCFDESEPDQHSSDGDEPEMTNILTGKSTSSCLIIQLLLSRRKVQIPRRQLPRDIRDKPVTSPLICPRRRRLPRFLDVNGLVADYHGNFSKHLDMLRWFETPKHPP